MAHEFWPHRIFTVDRLSSRSRVSSLCRPLRRGPETARFFLLGPVSDDGLRAVDLPRKPARHRGLSSLLAGQALPYGLPQSRGALDPGRCQRVTRLAYLRGFRPSVDQHGAAVVRSRSNGCRSGSKSVRVGLDNHRPLPLTVSVGPIPQAQSCRQDAHAAGPARQHPHVYPHYGGQGARCQHPRRVSSRGRCILM